MWSRQIRWEPIREILPGDHDPGPQHGKSTCLRTELRRRQLHAAVGAVSEELGNLWVATIEARLTNLGQQEITVETGLGTATRRAVAGLADAKTAEAGVAVQLEVRYLHPWRVMVPRPLLPLPEEVVGEAVMMSLTEESTALEVPVVGLEKSRRVGGMYLLTGAEEVRVGLGLLLAARVVAVPRAVAAVVVAAGTVETAAGVEAMCGAGAVPVGLAASTAAAARAPLPGAGAVTAPVVPARRGRGTASVLGPSLGPRAAIRAVAAPVAVAPDAALAAVSVAVSA